MGVQSSHLYVSRLEYPICCYNCTVGVQSSILSVFRVEYSICDYTCIEGVQWRVGWSTLFVVIDVLRE